MKVVRIRVLLATILITVQSLKADVVLDWTALALDCIRNDNTSPTVSTRNLAIFHAAIYDAVNSVTRTHQPYQFQINAPTNCSFEAAVVGAAHEVLTALYPSYAPWADELYDDYLATTTSGIALTNGLDFGWWIGLLTLDSRSNDGASTEVPYIPSGEPGAWQRTAPFFRPPLTPHWGYVDPFCLPDIEPFVPGPPPARDSPAYAVALNEVKAIGGKNSSLRTPEQSQIAVFWSDFSYTAMPPGHWHEIAVSIAKSQNNSLEENARMFALLSLAQADAAIVCWETKYRYNLWRPITAIQRADQDGNPASEQDATWDHYLASPPFPAYPSGHSTFSKASAQVLTHFYATDAIEFTATSDSLPGVTRQFSSLAACADEVGMSRLYGGIHFQFDNTAGKSSGRMVGDHVSTNFLLPNDQLPRVWMERISNATPSLRIHGQIGSECILEASPDLVSWQPISTNAACIGGVLIDDVGAIGLNTRFYRVKSAQ